MYTRPNRRLTVSLLLLLFAALLLSYSWGGIGQPELQGQIVDDGIGSPEALSASLNSSAVALGEDGHVVTVHDCQISVLQTASLGAQRAGVLNTIHVREGDRIEAGQVLISLQDDLARAAVALHEREAGNDVELRYARKVSDVARVEYQRALELNHEIPNAHSELKMNGLRMEAERALLQIEQAENRIEIARLKLAESRAALETYNVRSPLSGIVQRIHKARGEAALEGEPLIEVASFERLKIAADLPLDMALRLKRGMPVEVVAHPPAGVRLSRRLQAAGRVVFVDSKIHEVSKLVHIWAEIDNREGQLLAGMSATMRVRLD